MIPPLPFPLKYSEGVIIGGLDWGTDEGLASGVSVGAFSFEGDTGLGAAAGVASFGGSTSEVFFSFEGSAGFVSFWGDVTFGAAGGSALGLFGGSSFVGVGIVGGAFVSLGACWSAFDELERSPVLGAEGGRR